MNPYQKLLNRKRKWTPVQVEAGKVKEGAEEVLFRALALRHMELPVGDFIKDASRGDEFYYEIDTVDEPWQVTLTTPFQEPSSPDGIGFKAQYAWGTYETNPSPSNPRHVNIEYRENVPFDENVFWLFYFLEVMMLFSEKI